MNQEQIQVRMSNWQVTATTIYCDAVDDEVTLIVYKDLSAKCTGCAKFMRPSRETAKEVKKKSRQTKRLLKCEGDGCSRLAEYKGRLAAEEAGRGAATPTGAQPSGGGSPK